MLDLQLDTSHLLMGQKAKSGSYIPDYLFFFSCEMTSCSQKHIGIDLSCQKARLLWVVAASVLLLPALITKCHWFYRNIYHNILLCLCSSRDASIFWNIYPFLSFHGQHIIFCSVVTIAMAARSPWRPSIANQSWSAGRRLQPLRHLHFFTISTIFLSLLLHLFRLSQIPLFNPTFSQSCRHFLLMFARSQHHLWPVNLKINK